ncbi:MAG TPA: hypothetical protein VNM24_05265 [Burkholderiales bacterium]|nr:hypothetical protein [Burkholderiales bacterium]
MVTQIRNALPSGKTVDVILSALYDLYRHRDAGTFPARLTTVLARVVACDTAAYVRIDPAAGALAKWVAEQLAEISPARPAIRRSPAARRSRTICGASRGCLPTPASGSNCWWPKTTRLRRS